MNDLPADEQVSFDRIRPILQERCLPCHQGDYLGTPVPDFRTADGLLRSGRTPELVVPGDPESSRLLQVVYLDEERPGEAMPPLGHQLTAEEKNLLGEWIRQGAPWPAAVELESAAVRAAREL